MFWLHQSIWHSLPNSDDTSLEDFQANWAISVNILVNEHLQARNISSRIRSAEGMLCCCTSTQLHTELRHYSTPVNTYNSSAGIGQMQRILTHHWSAEGGLAITCWLFWPRICNYKMYCHFSYQISHFWNEYVHCTCLKNPVWQIPSGIVEGKSLLMVTTFLRRASLNLSDFADGMRQLVDIMLEQKRMRRIWIRPNSTRLYYSPSMSQSLQTQVTNT